MYHISQFNGVYRNRFACLLSSRINIVAMYIQFAVPSLILVLKLKHNTLTKITQILLLTGYDF